MPMIQLVFGLAILHLCASAAPSLSRSYKHTMSQSSTMHIHWEVDTETQELSLAMHAITSGWVGFGIMEVTGGGMRGSDIVLGWVDPDGTPHIKDMWTLHERPPIDDDIQDWKLVGHSANDTTTIIEVKRALVTGDSMDRDIVAGNTRVNWAFATSDKLVFHKNNWWEYAAEFVTGGSPLFPIVPAPTETDLKTVDVTFPNVTVPSKTTWYGCFRGELPTIPGGAHIVEIQPIVDGPTKEFIHHFVIYACKPTGKTGWDMFKDPETCPDFIPACNSPLWAWAPGGEDFVLPPEAGIFFGDSSKDYAATKLVLQVHYNNPNHKTGFKDSSGVRITYTQQKRKYDAATLMIGDIGLNLPDIPPKQDYVPYTTTCTTDCTSDWDHSITVFADFLHMHHAGKRIWTTIHRKDGTWEEYNRIDFWHFHSQRVSPVRRMTINPGDAINLHCVYDTHKRDKPTEFALGSGDEMCLDFLTYYPVLVKNNTMYSSCGYYGSTINGMYFPTACGAFVDASDLKMTPNPQFTDTAGCHTLAFGINGTVEKPVCKQPLRTDNLPIGAMKYLQAIAAPCEAWPCEYGGKCVSVAGTNYKSVCQCQKGFQGLHCQSPTAKICLGNPCGDNGECTPMYGEPYCKCKKGFYGKTCQSKTPITSKCNAHGFASCVFQATGPYECLQYQAYKQCAAENNCMGLLSLMCDAMIAGSECAYTICADVAAQSECSTAAYRQCYAELLMNKPKEFCDFHASYLNCAKYSHCSDSLAYTCKRIGTRCGALKETCAAASATPTLNVEEANLLDTSLQIPEEHRAAANNHSASGTTILGSLLGCMTVALVVYAAVVRKQRGEAAMEYEEMLEEMPKP
eukprot:TRINITY_DN112572_c0_g1_i1.p1 TRINITY_DN112572_c0_g1~~TRINITY_DN112572_c0_g1_i1.p1  ORF type:complete len:860 (-),score=93.51 TRINITY_DN112572_c0_g1_i1:618-3173(-)